MMIATPVFATVINNNSATCDGNTLGVTSGSVRLRAKYAPETINLRWYDNNTLLSVSSASNTCNYDSGLTLPAQPSTKPGYTFKGWKVVPQYDFSTLDVSLSGVKYSHGDGFYCCTGNWTCGADVCNTNNDFKELQVNEWKLVTSGTGTLYGVAKCSGKVGNNYSRTWNGDSSNYISTKQELESANVAKRYCWCQATGFKQSNSDVIKRPSLLLPWVFYRDVDGETDCANFCSYLCANAITAYSEFFRLLINR